MNTKIKIAIIALAVISITSVLAVDFYNVANVINTKYYLILTSPYVAYAGNNRLNLTFGMCNNYTFTLFRLTLAVQFYNKFNDENYTVQTFPVCTVLENNTWIQYSIIVPYQIYNAFAYGYSD